MHLSSILGDVAGEDQAEYRERVVRYVNSVFEADLDQEAFSAVQAERSVTSDISSLLRNSQQFASSFDEEANFCAGATQIHPHSPTCVKYSIRGQGKNRDPCRFKAPWRLVERTAFTESGVLQIRRNHSMVNRWNKDLHFVGMPPGTILLTPISIKIDCQRKRPWQKNDVSRRGLPCAPAFACTDYKVQSKTLPRVALELRGTRTTSIDGQAVPTQCDPYSLYMQLSRCKSLDGIMLLSKVRERDLVGNKVPDNMVAAEGRLEQSSDATIREAELWDWSG